jgi:hypothetical protein
MEGGTLMKKLKQEITESESGWPAVTLDAHGCESRKITLRLESCNITIYNKRLIEGRYVEEIFITTPVESDWRVKDVASNNNRMEGHNTSPAERVKVTMIAPRKLP